jgi:uncharacterized membrane protein
MKKISKRQYRFLEETLSESVQQSTLSVEQKNTILSRVEIRETLNFIRVLVTIGGILIGLGFLTFIATNWDLFDRWVKLTIILGSLSISLGASYYTLEKNKLTSLALLYVSVLIYGAGIFLLEQIFYINFDFNTGFLIWAIGALLLSGIHKDVILYVFAHILSGIYILSSFDDIIIIQLLVLLAIFYATNRAFGYRKLLTFFLGLLVIASVIYPFAYFESDAIYPFAFLFLIGNAAYYLNQPIERFDFSSEMLGLLGLLTIGVSGFVLTFPEIYNDISLNGTVISWIFAIALVLYLLYLTSKRLVTPLLAIAAIILRYYFDTFYDSIDRSLFFVIGGLLILGFGYYIETYRRQLSDEPTE